jgi:flavin-dependent dehydrogenase
MAAGAIEARTASFYVGDTVYREKALPRPALCVSRYVLDALLAEEFRSLGGELRERQRLTERMDDEGLVRATGRRLRRRSSPKMWVGLKAHMRGATLVTDLEMHFVPGGYVGLCRLNEGVTNVCGLIAVHGTAPELARRWQGVLRGPSGSALEARLLKGQFDETSFCAVSGLNLRPVQARNNPDCSIGDALSMIPPLTGNGMSMALESAFLAADILADYSQGNLSWPRARADMAHRLDAEFGRRLRWARWLHGVLLRPHSRSILLALGDRLDWVWQACFNRTRAA